MRHSFGRSTGGDQLLDVGFFGVRGSTPCPCDGNRRYGANTSCVALESPGHEPIVLDLGTGLRFWGETMLDREEPFRGSALVTHVHWDHVQGLPFFVPVLRPGSRLDVYGPPSEHGSLGDAFDVFLRPPFFPVSVLDLPGEIAFHDAWNDDLELDGAKVRVRQVPHVGPTSGYRIDMGGASIAYISDHQMPGEGARRVSEAVLELCDGVDLLIHDAQFTVEEFPAKSDWGHCTVDYAVLVAAEAGARRLALFHHDPSHDDEMIDRLVERACELPDASRVSEVMAANEGLHLSFGG